jgi:hypothetical protein
MPRIGTLLLALVVFASAALAGHDPIKVDPALKRYGGQVTALGRADDHGRIYSFRVKRLPSDTPYVPDELRGWRLTVLSGKRFSHAFEVQTNSETLITVSTQDGPVNGVAVNDVFVVENTPLIRQ